MTMLLMLFTASTARAQDHPTLTYNSAGGYYEIGSADDLNTLMVFIRGIAQLPYSYKMTCDIDMSGQSLYDNTNFTGTFDGDGHTISNLDINAGSGSYIGLFDKVGEGSTVKNLKLSNCQIQYSGNFEDTSVGGIVGENRGTIENCTVTGFVIKSHDQYNVGSIVGSNLSTGTVKNCTAIAGHPVIGTNSGSVTGCNAYYRLFNASGSSVGLTASPASITVAGVACYAANTALALTVTPNDGTQMLTDVTFTGATATKTAYGQYTLTMPEKDVSLTATLATKITVAEATCGSVTPSTYSPAVGNQVTLTIAPNTGYELNTITATAGGSEITLNGSGLTRTFTMPDKPVSISATFSKIKYRINGMGSRTGGTIGGPLVAFYGDEVSITALPYTGYRLQTLTVTTESGQPVALSGSGDTRTFTMPKENVTVSATFAEILEQYTVYVTAHNCTVEASPNPATQRQTVTLNIIPNSGATLQSIIVRSNSNAVTVTGSGNTRTFTMPASNAYVTVVCTIEGQLVGSGTQADPYLIFNETDLRVLSSLSSANYFLNNYIRLENDITMSNDPLRPIGDNNGNFYGNFDGNGHTISNLHISGRVDYYVGLFACSFGTISNLTLAGCTITGNETGTQATGGIAGSNYGTITNCHVTSGTISTTTFIVGGIAGSNRGTISGCSNGAAISGTGSESSVGGIMGTLNYARYPTVVGCLNSGSVSGPSNGHVGGIVGKPINDGTPTLKNNYYFGSCTTAGLNGSDITDNQGAVRGYAITKPEAVTLFNIEGCDLAHPDYAASGETVSFTVAVPEGYVIGTVKYNDGSDHTLTATDGVYSFTMPAKAVTITATFAPDPAHFEQTATNEYTIKTATGWDLFCDALQDNDTWNRFSGKTVKLVPTGNSNSITVTRMAGSQYHDFCGTFDGNGKTLTFNYGSPDTPANVQYIAPFHYVSTVTPDGGSEVPANFRNLHVAGDIYTSAKYAAGLIAQHWGTVNVENCRSSIVIHSSVSGDGTHGGFEAESKGGLNITGCVFDGKLLTTGTTATTNCGGFVGYGSLNVSNSLYAPAALSNGETEITSGSATFVRNSSAGSNCYYTRTLGAAQGKQARSIEAGENVTVGFSGTETEYNVSGITAYTTGIQYNNVFYAGSGDDVSLTLSHTDRPGYTFSGYEASAGTLSGTTLTMPDEDVIIAALWEAPGITLPIGTSGWATWYDTKSYTLSSGATAYYVSSVADGTVNLTAIEGGVPAGVPVLIKGSGTVTLTPGDVTLSGTPDTQFKGTATELTATDFTDFTDGRTYVLYGGKFMLVETNGGIGAHKCWLTLTAPTTARQLNISVEGATNLYPSIIAADESTQEGGWYDLQGRKLSGEPTKHGIYIFKGKKVKR